MFDPLAPFDDADAPRRAPAELLRWPTNMPILSLPAGFMDLLSALIEASDPDHAGALIALVASVQIQHARAREQQDAILRMSDHATWEIVVGRDVAACVVDAAEVIARSGKLLP